MATVMIVEDDLLARSLLKRLLEAEGHSACFADTVEGGWQVLCANILIDVVILDNLLGDQFGWQLLRDIRDDAIFKDIPVIVYTASSDRGSVIKFLKLGVQNLLVKPYVKARLMPEIDKALQLNWREKLFEPVEHVCHRLEIPADEYYRMLHLHAEGILDVIHQIKAAIGTARMRRSTTMVDKLHSIAKTLGIPALDEIASRLFGHLVEEDYTQSLADLGRAEVIAKLMQHRFAVYFEIQKSQDLAESVRHEEEIGSARRQQKQRDWAAKARQSAREKWQRMTAAPLFSFARAFAALEVVPRRWDEGPTRPAPATMLAQSLRSWLRISGTQPDVVVQALAGVPGLAVTLGRVLSQDGQRVSGSAALRKGLETYGMGPLLTALLVNLWQDEARLQENPIDLRPLAEYTVARAILYHELTRKLPEANEIVLGGTMPTLGIWLWALATPARFGLLVAWAQGSQPTFREASLRIFGELPEDAAGRLLVDLQASGPILAAARDFALPGQAEGRQSRVVAAMAQLAGALMAGQNIGYIGYVDEQGPAAFDQANAWAILASTGIEIPLEPTALRTALEPILSRVPRQVDALLELPPLPLPETSGGMV